MGIGLLLVGFVGPDSLGAGHGEYLPQRLELLGLAALVPGINLKLGGKLGRLTASCLVIAVALQSVIVWDYAIHSERTAGQIIRLNDLVGRNQRMAPLLIRIRSRFRANPLLHAESWLGVGTGNILWSNYETRHYYFPVQFRPGIERPDPFDFERLALSTDPDPGERSRLLWEQLLDRSSMIDRIVVWGSDPALDALTERHYDLVGLEAMSACSPDENAGKILPQPLDRQAGRGGGRVSRTVSPDSMVLSMGLGPTDHR